MSRTPNFETIVMSSILLEAYFREHSINVTIVPIGCQMAEISVKNGPIVIKKSYGFDFGGDFCSYVLAIVDLYYPLLDVFSSND